MIKKLDNSKEDIALQIFNVFQRSYQVEAQLIGVQNFPPLLRKKRAIELAKTRFYGFIEDDSLVAVIEITLEDQCLDIESLTVDPSHFRKGIANSLIRYVLEELSFSKATVETAVANTPAIKLYEKHGFVEFKRWTPDHGIEKLAMSVKPALM